MERRSAFVRLSRGLGYGLAGGLFFFAIIGVFGLRIAIGSLVLFIVLTILLVCRTVQDRDGA